jgi:hypothetical protein
VELNTWLAEVSIHRVERQKHEWTYEQVTLNESDIQLELQII